MKPTDLPRPPPRRHYRGGRRRDLDQGRGAAGRATTRAPAGGRRDRVSALSGYVLAHDDAVARHCAVSQDSRRADGRALAVDDGVIAAICVVRGTALATSNRHGCAGLGLELIDPCAACVS